jgi:hypothetical protein
VLVPPNNKILATAFRMTTSIDMKQLTRRMETKATLSHPHLVSNARRCTYIFYSTKQLMYTNQTGHFPRMSSKGNIYIMVAVEMDGNYNDGEQRS